MPEIEQDKVREDRIHREAAVDAYGEEVRALGSYYYLEDKLHFPFPASCITKRAKSPLKIGDEVDVVGMAPETECEHDMFVMIRWEDQGLAVPLSQLQVVHADEETLEAVEDWQYWMKRGYQF